MRCWLFKRDDDLVLVGLMKKEEFNGVELRFVGIMWEVHNGIHMHQTRSSMAYLKVDKTRLLDDLLCLQNVDLHGVKMEEYGFDGREDEFWKFVEDNNMQQAIVKSRLSKAVEQLMMKQRRDNA